MATFVKCLSNLNYGQYRGFKCQNYHSDHEQIERILHDKGKSLMVDNWYIRRKFSCQIFFLQTREGSVNIFDKHNFKRLNPSLRFSILRCHLYF